MNLVCCGDVIFMLYLATISYKHTSFSDFIIIAIIATKLKTLLMLNAIYSRSLFLVFIKDKSLKILNAIIQNTAILENRYSFRMFTVISCHCSNFY